MLPSGSAEWWLEQGRAVWACLTDPSLLAALSSKANLGRRRCRCHGGPPRPFPLVVLQGARARASASSSSHAPLWPCAHMVPGRPHHFTVLSDGVMWAAGWSGCRCSTKPPHLAQRGPGGHRPPSPAHPLHSVLQPLPCSLFFPLKTHSAHVHSQQQAGGRHGRGPCGWDTAGRARHTSPYWAWGLCLFLLLQRLEGTGRESERAL